MPAISKHTRHFTLLFLTSLGIVAFMLFYIFGYIPDNERRINARSYRVLQRMGDNMSISVRNYNLYVASSFVSGVIIRELSNIKKSELEKNADKLGNKKLNSPIELTSLINYLKIVDKEKPITAKFGLSFYFTDYDKETDNPGKSKSIQSLDDNDQVALNYQAKKTNKPNDAKPEPENSKAIHYLEENGQLYLHFQAKITPKTYKALEEEIEKKEKDSLKLGESIKNNKFHIKVPVDSLLNSLMREDAFDHLIVLRQDGTATIKNKKDDKEQTVPVFTTVYNSGQSADLIPLDTLAHLANKATGAGPANVSIAGVPYKLYTLTQRVGLNEKWFLYGAVSAEKYETESRAIPAHLVSLAALAVVLLFMAFPFLKLMLMNKQERLYRQDVVFSFLFLVVGVALVVILLFDCYAYYGIDRYAEKKRLEVFSADLQQNLKKEIKLLLAQIQHFENAAAFSSQKNGFSANYKFTSNPYWLGVDQQNKIIKTSDFYFPALQRVFWINKEGMMSRSWAAKEQNNARVYVGYRPYFTQIKVGGGSILDNKTPKFALESITSNTDGEKYAVISTKSQRPDAEVVALATKLSSLYKTILPPGYDFCFIDKAGEVLFHHNPNLNLNENLLEETNHNPYLKAALYGQVPAHFTNIYQGSQKQLFVSPVKDLPFFLVTYVNDAYHKASNLNVIVLAAMFLSLYFVSIAILAALIIYLNEGFAAISFKWLWPKKNISQVYFKIILAFIIIIVLILLFATIDYQISLYFIHVYVALYTFIFIYSALNGIPFRNILRRSWPVLIGFNLIGLFVSLSVFLLAGWFQILLILLFLVLDENSKIKEKIQLYSQYKIVNYFFPEPQKYHRVYVGMLACWFVLVSGFPAFMLFKVAYNYEAELAVRYNQSYLAQALKNVNNEYPENKSGAKILWIMLSSIKYSMPKELYDSKFIIGNNALQIKKEKVFDLWSEAEVLKSLSKKIVPDSLMSLINNTSYPYTNFFYHTAYTTNSALAEQTDYATASTPKKSKEVNAGTTSKPAYLPALILNIRLPNLPQRLKKWLEGETELLNSFILVFRPIFRNVLADGYFLKTNKSDGWQSEDHHHLQFSYQNQGNQIWLSSHLPKYTTPPLFYASSDSMNWSHPFKTLTQSVNKSGWLFWADIVLLSVLYYILISFVIKRLFNLDQVAKAQKKNWDLNFFQPKNENNLFLISLPHPSDLKKAIRQKNKTYSCKFQEFDLEIIPKAENLDTAKRKFEETLKAIATLNKKQKVFYTLKRKKQPPAIFFLIRNFDSDPFSKVSLEFKIYVLHVLTNFSKVKIILQSALPPAVWEEELSKEQLKSEQVTSNAAYILLLQQLLMHLNTYSKMYQPQHQSLLEEQDPSPDSESADKVPVNSKANLIQLKLWSDCTAEEQYLLVIMAQGRLVNSKNEKVISSLLKKGLIENEGELLKTKNESFKNFILHTELFDLVQTVEKECAATEYLEVHYKGILKTFVQENYKKTKLQRVDIILRLQSFAQLYYRSLWLSCTAEEQYFLFDMAQDGLVNSKNVHVLSSLLGKGLITVDKDGLLNIMNESFKNFILVAVNPADALRFEKSSTQGSSWSVYKTPLLLILIGAVLFFFFTQKNSWANIIAVLTAVSTFVSILPRLSFLIPSFLAGKENKSE